MILQDNKPAAPYKKKPFPNWDKMVDICEGASATGEDAFHPGESILMAGKSFQELDGASEPKSDMDDSSDEHKNEQDDPAASDEEVHSLSTRATSLLILKQHRM